MKYLFTLCLCFFAYLSKSQTLTYYSFRSNTDWSCITYYDNVPNTPVIFNSSKIKTPVLIQFLTNQSKNNVNVSTVHLGDDPTVYILVQDKNNLTFTLTDQRQMFRNDFTLDSKIYYKDKPKQFLSNSDLTGLLTLFKLLI